MTEAGPRRDVVTDAGPRRDPVAAPRPRLVALGWHAPGTGFDRVLNAILSRLSAGADVHLAGIGHAGEAFDRDGYRVHPTNPHGDSLGAYAARGLMDELRPAALLVLHDVWHMGRYERLLRSTDCSTRRVVYFPLDGNLIDASLAEPLLRFDAVVTYCAWARGQVADAWRRLGAAPAEWPALLEIPHGLDTTAFRPLATPRARLKHRLFPTLSDPGASFVVLNASRPARRKRLDLTLAGFARFARDKPAGVLLCLHWAIFTEREVEEIRRLAAELGIGDRLVLNPLTPAGGPLPDEQLNLLYNACDVGLNTSSGEGWGLVTFEHAATGAAQIVPRHSACADLWEGAALLVEPVRRLVPDYSLLEMAEPDADGVAVALERLYSDSPLRRTLAGRARRRAADPALCWDSIAERWRETLMLPPGVVESETTTSSRLVAPASPA